MAKQTYEHHKQYAKKILGLNPMIG